MFRIAQYHSNNKPTRPSDRLICTIPPCPPVGPLLWLGGNENNVAPTRLQLPDSCYFQACRRGVDVVCRGREPSLARPRVGLGDFSAFCQAHCITQCSSFASKVDDPSVLFRSRCIFTSRCANFGSVSIADVIKKPGPCPDSSSTSFLVHPTICT